MTNKINTEKLLELVIRSAQNVVSYTNTADPSKINKLTHLYGVHGVLDSLGLVQLIAEVEDEIYESTGINITIADERAMSLKFSPFRSVSSLADYILVLLKERNE